MLGAALGIGVVSLYGDRTDALPAGTGYWTLSGEITGRGHVGLLRELPSREVGPH